MSAAGSDERIAVADDPTDSGHIRDPASTEVWRRYRSLRGRVRSELEAPSGELREFSPDPTQTAGPVNLPTFRRWLTSEADAETLGSGARVPERGRHWSASYIRDAYRHGLERADLALEERGYDVPLRRPPVALRDDVHREALTAVLVQTVNDLAGNTNQAVTHGTRVYGDALGTASVSALAGHVNGRIDAVAETNAQATMANRIVHSVNVAAVNRYDTAGVATIGAVIEAPGGEGNGPNRAEWVIAQDGNVCAECASLGGSTYTMKAVRAGRVPIPGVNTHPYCRCFIIPA